MAEAAHPELGARVRAAREERGYSQERLADLARVSRNAIYNLENVGTVPKADTLWRIANATGRDMDWFFGVDDGSPAAPPPPPPPPERGATQDALRAVEAAQAQLAEAHEKLRQALAQPDRVAEAAPDELARRRKSRGAPKSGPEAVAHAREELRVAQAAGGDAELATAEADEEFLETLADTFSEEDDPGYNP